MRFNIIRSPAYEEGRSAYLAGAAQESNPYDSEPESTPSVDWLQGYAEAATDKQNDE